MSESRALVVLYKGEQPSSLTLERIIAALSGQGVTSEKIEVIQLDSTDIAKSIVPTEALEHFSSSYNAEESAAIYIGTKFANALATSPYGVFAVEFTNYITTIRFTHADPEMVKAVNIIAGKDVLQIRKSLRTKYRITDKVLQLIKRVGQYV